MSDKLTKAARTTETLWAASQAAAATALGGPFAGLGLLGAHLLRLGQTLRSEQRRAERDRELEAEVEQLRQETGTTVEALGRRIEALADSVEWLRANYLDTLDESRASALRHASSRILFTDADAVWAGLLSRVITLMSPAETLVLLTGAERQGKVPEDGVMKAVRLDSIWDLTLEEDLGAQAPIVQPALAMLVSRGLLAYQEPDRLDEPPTPYGLTPLGLDVVRLVGDELPPHPEDAEQGAAEQEAEEERE